MQNMDLLELLIYARGSTMQDNESIPSKTHLQKEMFLLLKETIFSKVDGYKFMPHYYGPFSRELDSDLIELVVSGHVNDVDGFTLTPGGFKDAQILWNSQDNTHKMALSRIKERYNRLTSEDLLDYVYGKYKKYTVRPAVILENLYSYFDAFAIENAITIDELDSAFNRIRHPVNESRN
ncbi:MAG: hypothetical protein ACYCR2_09895 [Thermoplasmataceae archaeon]